MIFPGVSVFSLELIDWLKRFQIKYEWHDNDIFHYNILNYIQMSRWHISHIHIQRAIYTLKCANRVSSPLYRGRAKIVFLQENTSH